MHSGLLVVQQQQQPQLQLVVQHLDFVLRQVLVPVQQRLLPLLPVYHLHPHLMQLWRHYFQLLKEMPLVEFDLLHLLPRQQH